MITSTEIAVLTKRVGFEKAIEYVAKAGFDAYDLSMFSMIEREGNEIFASNTPFGGKDYIKHVKKIKRLAEDNGIFCNQSHAPFYGYMDKVGDFVKRAIECAAEAGAKNCVVHPDAFSNEEQVAERYLNLLPFAKAHGVKIATENIWNMVNGEISPIVGSNEKSLKTLVDLVNDDYFVVCLDVGHSYMQNLNTSGEKIINALGNKIEALHIHDNDLVHDQHIKPGDGKIDFHAVVKALKKNNYKGDFTLEADRQFDNVLDEDIFEETKKLYLAVRAMADEFDSL